MELLFSQCGQKSLYME